MRSTWQVLGAAVSLVLVPQMVAATTVEEQMELMQQRLSQLEDRLQATDDDLAAANSRVEEQQLVLEGAGLEEGGAVSALSSFLSETDFYGWVNASYTQGFRGNSSSAAGQNLPVGFHPDNMSFAVNQVWFGMDHASTEESRAGFHVDMLYGADARARGNGGGFFGPENSFELYTAYVSYLAPIGNGIEIQGGQVPTLNGAEVLQTTQNLNITRGILWNLQPVNTIGVLLSTDLGGGFTTTMGVLNDVYLPGSTDINLDKSVTAQVGWSNDSFGATVTGNWGYGAGVPIPGITPPGVNPFTHSNTALVDGVFTYDAADNMSFWLNYDWIGNFIDGGATSQIHGVALAGRVGLTDATGVAVRGEYVYVDGNATTAFGGVVDDGWSVTGTLDHQLTDNLLVRAEYRYDGNKNAAFAGKLGQTYKDQHLIVVDATYEF